MIIVLSSASCGLLPTPPGSTPAPSPRALAEPLAFHQVTEVRPAPCPAQGQPLLLPDPNDPQSCLLLGPSRLTVTELEQVGIEPAQSGYWMVLITFRPADADTVTALTTELSGEQDPANRMAMIIGEELIMAPAVQDPIPGGKLQLVGSFTREEVDALVQRLGG